MFQVSVGTAEFGQNFRLPFSSGIALCAVGTESVNTVTDLIRVLPDNGSVNKFLQQ
jgi:hypothetical protein